MFELARAIAKRRAEIDVDKYNKWLCDNGHLPNGRTEPTPGLEPRMMNEYDVDTSVLAGQHDPKELITAAGSTWFRGESND